MYNNNMVKRDRLFLDSDFELLYFAVHHAYMYMITCIELAYAVDILEY